MSRKLLIVATLLLLMPLLALAQQIELQPIDDDSNTTPHTLGPYTVNQSVEFGGHIAGVSGNQATYDTFTNIQSGPRLLGQSLTMTAPSGTGRWFDSLYEEAFGFGGDPNNMARLRIKKAKWYEFTALYRRDQNYFDYNLFANPLTFNNPSNLVKNDAGLLSPFLANSPHEQITTRNMGDFNLTLFPLSIVSVRLGYSRDNNQGLIDSTLHEANEIGISSPDTRLRGDTYRFGVDFRPATRTTLSFDETYEHDHLNYNYVDNPFSGFFLDVNGVPVQVDPGIPLQTNTNMVTSGCLVSGALGFANGVVNPACNNGTFFYNRSYAVRTGIPTEQLSLQSNYFRNLDITASFVYGTATSDLGDYNDVWSGVGSHSDARLYDITGPATIRRITNNADFGLAYHLARKWTITDQFRYLNWREPGAADQIEYNCFPASTTETVASGIVSPCGLTSLLAGTSALGPGLTGTAVSPTSPFFNSTTYPFASSTPYSEYLAQRSFFNTAKLRWDPNRRIGAFIGFRYGRREVTQLDYVGVVESIPLAPPTTDTTTLGNATNAIFTPSTFAPYDTVSERLNEYTGLGGINLRPTDAWRINADTEILYSDNAFTDITPRHQQKVRINTNYKVNRRANVFGSVNIVQTQNDWATNIVGVNAAGVPLPAANLFPSNYIPAYGHTDHNRWYTVGLNLQATSRLDFDFGYTYLDQAISSASCLFLSSGLVPVTASGAASPLTAPGACPAVNFTLASVPGSSGAPPITGGLPLVLDYTENTNTFYGNVTYKPAKRVTLTAGYEITADNGNNLWIRGDNGQPLYFAVDQFLNIVAPGSSTAIGVAPGPNPLVPAGTQAFDWHQAHFGVEIPLATGLAFHGLWNYYDYYEKNAVELAGPNLVPRAFHDNVGTLALKYSF